MPTLRSDLTALSRPFPPEMIQKAPQGKYGDFVGHPEVTQWLLLHAGPFSFGITELMRGVHKIGGKEETVVVGCLAQLTCTIDGQEVTIVEVGDCENPANWKTDGARAKDASSDAIKRCAMRLGVGLHLWSTDYFLRRKLLEGAKAEPDGATDA